MNNKKESSFYFTPSVLIYPLLLAFTIWFVFWVEIRLGVNFTRNGIHPRTFSGLQGILFSPFIHSGITHLWHNTIPIMLLSTALFYFYRSISWKMLLLLWILTGTGTWIIGREAYHIGMSGIIYGLVSFLFFKGIIAKHFRLIALSLVVVFVYGSLIWGTLPIDPVISWEGHLSGFVFGLILALSFRQSIPKQPKYSWEEDSYIVEEDPFMRHFDKQGNFIEFPEQNMEVVEIENNYIDNQDRGEEE